MLFRSYSPHPPITYLNRSNPSHSRPLPTSHDSTPKNRPSLFYPSVKQRIDNHIISAPISLAFRTLETQRKKEKENTSTPFCQKWASHLSATSHVRTKYTHTCSVFQPSRSRVITTSARRSARRYANEQLLYSTPLAHIYVYSFYIF